MRAFLAAFACCGGLVLFVSSQEPKSGPELAPEPEKVVEPQEERWRRIDREVSRMPRKRLIPPIPETARRGYTPVNIHSLEYIVEVEYEPALPASMPALKELEHHERTLAKIRRLDAETPNGFIEALKRQRPDLGGLPFLIDEKARLPESVRKHIRDEAEQIHNVVRSTREAIAALDQSKACCQGSTDFDRLFPLIAFLNDQGLNGGNLHETEFGVPIPKSDDKLHASVLMAKQILFPGSPGTRIALIQFLQTVSHPSANVALAEVAVFAPETTTRKAALRALKIRRPFRQASSREELLDFVTDPVSKVFYDAILAPYSPINIAAADAMIELNCQSLLADLASDLQRPASPFIHNEIREVSRRNSQTNRYFLREELVKIEHARNCMLCHPPAVLNSEPPTPKAKQQNHPFTNFFENSMAFPNLSVALVPLSTNQNRESTPRSPFLGGYRSMNVSPSAIRFDVTYLRPLFSLNLPRTDLSSTSDQTSRFDFIVRRRLLNNDEIKILSIQEKGNAPPPFSSAVNQSLRVLRELTGQDFGYDSERWRDHLAKENNHDR